MKEVKEALKVLIQGENDAVQHYSAFSDVAAREGYVYISILFKALAMAEKIHIKNHHNALGEDFTPIKCDKLTIGTTMENLLGAVKGEIEESKNLYPKLIKKIKKYKNTEYGKVAKLSMIWAKEAEKVHASLLKKALKSLKDGHDIKFDRLAICQVCGNLAVDDIADKECKVCGHDIIFFESIPMENL